MQWNSEDAAEATGGRIAGQWQASGVAIDSRTMPPGALYVAIVGERVDAHQFVQEALEKQGAAAVMVSRIPEGVSPEKLLVVSDTLEALQDLGSYNRNRSAAKIVGVTGSVGKTSTKEMLRTALAAHGETFASHGNFNNHIGTPLNLANLPASAKFAVCEMGMNHAGEIELLTNMVRPHVALITNVEAVHLEFFAGVEQIADAKSEIFLGMEPGGVAVLNRDNAHYARCAAHAEKRGLKIISFGKQNADCTLISYTANGQGCRVVADIAGERVDYTLKTIGEHWALTSVAVLAVTKALSLDIAKTAKALAEFSELPGRGKLCSIAVSGGVATLMDDSYNASPAAMRAAFAKLKEINGGRKIAALGDMRELGDSAPMLHAELAQALIASGVEQVFTAGPLMQHLHNALPEKLRAAHVTQASELVPLLKAALKANDVLLVKGSHGSKMYEVAEQLMAQKEFANAV